MDCNNFFYLLGENMYTEIDDLKHAYKTGLRKSMKGVCLNTGRTHFKKGGIPWNKKKEKVS